MKLESILKSIASKRLTRVGVTFSFDLMCLNNNNNNNSNKDVEMPADRNVVQKEAEKKLKYKSLCIKIQRMWNLKYTIIPVIIGATGIVTKSLKKNLEAVPGKHSIDSLQKTAILGPSHIIRKVLQYKN